MQQDEVLVGELAHDAGCLQEGLGAGRGWLRVGGGGGMLWGHLPLPRCRVGGLLPPHLGAVAVAAVHDLEHHLGLVVPVLLLVPLDARVDAGEGALAQALALPREGDAGELGGSPPVRPATPPPVPQPPPLVPA